MYGVSDEAEGTEANSQPFLVEYMQQLGFSKGKKIAIADAGAWGTMVDALKKLFPDVPFTVDFFYSHMPERIHGFANSYAGGISDSYLEAINDFFEAFPKAYKRPELLVKDLDGKVHPYYFNLHIDSPFLSSWSNAAMRGVAAAAQDFLNGNLKINVSAELGRLCLLSDKAKEGMFTGMLPEHTDTWEHGEEWKRSWPWGTIKSLL